MASVDSPSAPAAPIPASPQSKPLGAETRTICTAGWDGVVLAGRGLSSSRAEAAAGTTAPSARARVSVLLILRWFRAISGLPGLPVTGVIGSG